MLYNVINNMTTNVEKQKKPYFLRRPLRENTMHMNYYFIISSYFFHPLPPTFIIIIIIIIFIHWFKPC